MTQATACGRDVHRICGGTLGCCCGGAYFEGCGARGADCRRGHGCGDGRWCDWGQSYVASEAAERGDSDGAGAAGALVDAERCGRGGDAEIHDTDGDYCAV